MNRFLGILLFAGVCAAQKQDGARQTFEVATIKPCGPDEPGLGVSSTPGTVTLSCMVPANLILWAYVLYDGGTFHMVGGRPIPIENRPGWSETDRYTIQAKAAGTPTQETMLGPMLQTLLEDRFGLRLRRELREVSLYNLVLGKNPQNFTPAEPGSCRPLTLPNLPAPPAPGQPVKPFCKMARVTPAGFDVFSATMADLATQLSARLDRDVIDKTGIEGTFDFHAQVRDIVGMLAPPPPPPPGARGAPSPPPAGGTPERVDPADIFTSTRAIIDKLGLKIESAKGPGRFLVIEHIERPSPN